MIANLCRNLARAATSGTVPSGLSNTTLFNPPSQLAPAIKMFRNLVLQDLASLPLKRTQVNPLSSAGLKSLWEQKDLVIRSANKGGGIVLLDKTDYVNKMYRILSDHDT